MKRASPTVALGLGCLAALTFGGAACRPDFAPFNRVTSLRVLAIQSDPSLPTTGETATLTPLLYVPPDAAAPTFAWSWCPFPGAANDGYKCLVTEEDLNAMLASVGGAPVPPFDLGAGPTAALSNSLDPAILTAICSGQLPGQPARLDCTNGFPVQVKVTVATDTDMLTAVETVRLRFTPTVAPDPPIYGLDAPNTLPAILDLATMMDGAPTVLGDTPVVTLPRDVVTKIRADVDQAAVVESYPGADDQGNPTTLTEHLFMTWFVESGETMRSRTSYLNDTTPFEDFQKNEWTPAKVKDYPPSTARLFVVIHDNRGGVSWASGTVNLDPTP